MQYPSGMRRMVSQKKVYNKRICITFKVVGDEYHFVIECQINTYITSTF